jgi:DNA-binding response OmpR family regulator
MMDALLRMYGYKVMTVCTEAKAQAALKREKFNLLIFDGLGHEPCKQIREYDRITPILFLTGWAYQDDIDTGMSAGAQAYLIKPVNVDALMEAIAQFNE